jgi:hypothetical protein
LGLVRPRQPLDEAIGTGVPGGGTDSIEVVNGFHTAEADVLRRGQVEPLEVLEDDRHLAA